VIWYNYIYDPDLAAPIKSIMIESVKTGHCTCGAAKAAEPYPPTGHADYCDINNPAPDTEELPF
jgi:hypothetical protein